MICISATSAKDCVLATADAPNKDACKFPINLQINMFEIPNGIDLESQFFICRCDDNFHSQECVPVHKLHRSIKADFDVGFMVIEFNID